jgi:hypothetical protein
MAISRRNALKSLGAAAAAPLFDSGSFRFQAEDLNPAMLAAIAEVVLPAETDRKAAVAARRLVQPLPLDQARAACDVLQRDLATIGQFAGYVV